VATVSGQTIGFLAKAGQKQGSRSNDRQPTLVNRPRAG
jgi:hypothetical protein